MKYIMVAAIGFLLWLAWMAAFSIASIEPAKRVITITQLDAGYTVRCEEERNPYSYREAAVVGIEEALMQARGCLVMKMNRDWGR